MWDLSALSRVWSRIPCTGRGSPNHRAAGKSLGPGVISSSKRSLTSFLKWHIPDGLSVPHLPRVPASPPQKRSSAPPRRPLQARKELFHLSLPLGYPAGRPSYLRDLEILSASLKGKPWSFPSSSSICCWRDRDRDSQSSWVNAMMETPMCCWSPECSTLLGHGNPREWRGGAVWAGPAG